jgi:hypothetical protein
MLSVILELTSKQSVRVLYKIKEDQNYLTNYLEGICYCINIFLSTNTKNEVSFHVYNEIKAGFIFPKSEKDFQSMKTRNFREIALSVKRRIYKFLESTIPLNTKDVQLSKALFKAFCCNFNQISTEEPKLKISDSKRY